METLIVITALCIIPRETAVNDTCDLIEMNHMYSDSGELVLSQAIFYSWDESQARFQVVDWRLWKSNRQPSKLWHINEYEIIWHDGDVLRRVRAKCFVVTWTQHDPEMRERSVLAKEFRRGLTPRRDAVDEQ